MTRFRIDSIGELARQMRFASAPTRNRQIDAAETLLHEIEPSRAYPLDFVVYRITGYHPREVDSNLLTGLALQHDLGALIETVSASMALRAQALPEPVLSIDDLTERFHVTSKTIQRWRRKGLPARRIIFDDGKCRVGFLLSSVERFIAANQEQVKDESDRSSLCPADLEEMLRQARRLAVTGRCGPGEISRRIARRCGRSAMMVLHTIRKHDKEHPDAAIFDLAPRDLSPSERAGIVRAYRHGTPVAALADRLGRARPEVGRVILEDRIGRLLKRRMRFHDDPLYHQPDAAAVIDAIASGGSLADVTSDKVRIPRDLPPYIADLYRIPLLSAKEERGLFLKLNFHKFQFVTLRRRIDPDVAGRRDYNALESALRQVIQTRNAILRANLRLVVSVARRHVRAGVGLMELISEGNLILMRAIDGFDVHRNTRLSTYATFALMTGFARLVPNLRQAGRRSSGDPHQLLEVPDPNATQRQSRVADREQVDRLLGVLSERERDVMSAHYGLCGDQVPSSYAQLSERLGVTRQRIRQIEKSALRKLRLAAAVGGTDSTN